MSVDARISLLTALIVLINSSQTTVLTADANNAIIKSLFQSNDGDLIVALIINRCNDIDDLPPPQTLPLSVQSLISAAIWTIDRLNAVNFTGGSLDLGLAVYETCTDLDDFRTIFQLFVEGDFIGAITTRRPSERITKFSEVLGVRVRAGVRCPACLMHGVVEVLSALGRIENVIVIAPSPGFVREFFEHLARRGICASDYFIFGKDSSLSMRNYSTDDNFVVFGDSHHIKSFLAQHQRISEDISIIFVPLDGSVMNNLPQNSYVFEPPHYQFASTTTNKTIINAPPISPLLFEVAAPIINYAENAIDFIRDNCNETLYKLNCLKTRTIDDFSDCYPSPAAILDVLKIESKTEFVYNIFFHQTKNKSRNENTTNIIKIFSYNILDHNLTALSDLDLDIDNNNHSSSSLYHHCQVNSHSNCANYCKNYNSINNATNFIAINSIDLTATNWLPIRIRTESWVFAFLSLSLLGVLFCLSILIFLLVCICRRDILEGNPVLTMMLLVAVMSMYCAVLPLSVDGVGTAAQQSVRLVRALAITLSYASAFSLILSRCILLATAAKEVGFMAHIGGSVQAFLCLFIFGVQAALSLQAIGHGGTSIFRGHQFIYLLSYNMMLILLLVCLGPLVYKSLRNYGEGRYFAIAMGIVAGLWSVWLTCYGVLDDEWKDPVLCFGLVATGSVLLGAIFIPRTYLMTLAAARDKITSTLPSASSAMDIYRASTQPVYDCINIAAINAASIGNGIASIPRFQHQQPDLYSCPNLPEDDDEFERQQRCDTPLSTDKVTRF